MPRNDPDDPVALRSERLFGIFARYVGWRMSRDFAGVRLSRAGASPAPPGPLPGPLIVYCNHPGWWDPILLIVLSRLLFPGRAGFAPMRAAEFERYGVFRRMGVFGIDPASASGARRFLRVADRVLAAPDRMMWITAEGSFNDPRRRPVRLRPGIAHLALRAPHAGLVPLALSYEFWNESRPEALARFGPPVDPDAIAAARPGGAAAIGAMLAAALERCMDGLAEDAAGRDPSRFRTLIEGRTGTDAIYDAWRRLRAGLALRRFRAAHGSES